MRDMNNYAAEIIVDEHCKDCDCIRGCLELARATEPCFWVKCSVFSVLERTIRGE